eukprot:811207_1
MAMNAAANINMMMEMQKYNMTRMQTPNNVTNGATAKDITNGETEGNTTQIIYKNNECFDNDTDDGDLYGSGDDIQSPGGPDDVLYGSGDDAQSPG